MHFITGTRQPGSKPERPSKRVARALAPEDNRKQRGAFLARSTWQTRKRLIYIATPETGSGVTMKLQMLLIVGFAVGIVGCAEKEQAEPQQDTDVSAQQESAVEETTAAVTEAPAVEEAPEDRPDTTFAQIESWRTADLLDHMHAHAEHLDDLNFALDDGNLERATTSAYWLSRHDKVKGLPEEFQPFVDRMRDAARAVEAADDLDAARTAAQQIGTECQGCHTATGVSVE